MTSITYFSHSSQHNECCNDSPTPDDTLFRHLALVYSKNHPTMRTGHNCEETFPDGITNGAHWYELSGMLILNSNVFDSFYGIVILIFIYITRWNARFQL